ncbi:peptidyl-tRNA hydrolase, PTH1 family [Desulfurobacterium pacificum]|uniref:Peptidyl-tRNA hydrolase n=1 Tax=Desulfurobacterium pacificum TaxID=240166 RepID=A0ABY1NJX7_9BACT|nr:aminoacyl-tRNA hydrolase [Desulfurobacterium pacificum]SMP10892.1 peptidyl-tRNA hydrolase, PTH1 family [Desulfurobacterium pacificum]
MVKLIVGLGNPGKEYENTRHNVGWMIIDRVCEKLSCSDFREKFKGLIAEWRNEEGEKVFFLKPLTYMNRSGESVKEVANFFKINPAEILVIYDDLDLPLGKLRIRLKGSSGGHRGVKSVEEHLKTNEFPRLRIGIGRPATKEEVVNYVLSPFRKEELSTVEKVIERASDCVLKVLESGNITNKILTECNK